jgi:YfiH family protein
MLFHTESFFHIAFGDLRTQFVPQDFYMIPTNAILQEQPFCVVKKYMKIKNLIFLQQVHGNSGLLIENYDQLASMRNFELQGDFIISSVGGIGIAIATADCLPIILYSPTIPVIAIIHAGWRGSVERVAIAALEQMKSRFKIHPSTVRVFFGPSAKRCCYNVGQEVLGKLNPFSFKDEVLWEFDGQTYFDLPLFNKLQLQDAGIKASAFNLFYNFCTLCGASFCSYRTFKNSQRQMTVVALK